MTPRFVIERLSEIIRRNRPRATIDFETRSAADIRHGAWMYSKHKTTRILCLCFVLPGQDPEKPSRWMAPMAGHEEELAELSYFAPRPGGGYYDLEALFDYVRAEGLVEAHNVGFERAIWTHIFTRPEGYDENGATGMGAPPLKDTQLYDSAAKTSAYALPRALGEAGAALGLPVQKDEEGKKVMLTLSKPRKARKGEPHFGPDGEELIYYADFDIDKFTKLVMYCADDVRAEHALSEALPDLSEFEYQVWLADLRANWRGVKIDRDLVESAIWLDQQVKAQMNEQLWEITGVEKGTARAQVMAWLNEHAKFAEHDLPDLVDTAAPTLDWLMARPQYEDLDPEVQLVIHIARNINRTSVTKYKRILQCMDPEDGRVRELVLYHGAATGRWSGKGIQVQNFPRGNIGELTKLQPYHPEKCPHGWSMARAVLDVKTRDLEWCKVIYGDVLALISSTLRGALIPGDGKVFYVADYSAIEARVVLWLADAQGALDVFRRGEDIYCDMASRIYRRPITKKDKAERQFGKVTILGLGYGMGFLTFLLNLRSYDLKFKRADAVAIMGDQAQKYLDWVQRRLWPVMPQPGSIKDPKKMADAMVRWRNAARQAASDRRRLIDAREVPEEIVHELALCKFTVDTYRASYPEVKALWYAQEDAAIEAVMQWEDEKARVRAINEVECEKAWGEVIPEMCEPTPEQLELKPVRCGKVTWVVDDRYLFCILPSGRRLVYTDPFLKSTKTDWGETRPELRFMGVHKKFKRWERMATYGGSIVENIDQATARDMMAVALVAMSAAPNYDPIASIHDELLSEGDRETGDYKEYEELMVTLPEWADGCPVASEGDVLERYQK